MNSRLQDSHALEELYGQLEEPAALWNAVAGSPGGRPSSWSKADEARLSAMVRGGEMTFRQMAGEFGITRNAVIGKCDRMGLRGMPREKRAVRPKPIPKPNASTSDQPVPKPWRPRPRQEPRRRRSRAAVDFLGLTDRTCRWPLWDDTGHTPFHQQFYCGAAALPESPYCGECARKAFTHGATDKRAAGRMQWS